MLVDECCAYEDIDRQVFSYCEQYTCMLMASCDTYFDVNIGAKSVFRRG